MAESNNFVVKAGWLNGRLLALGGRCRQISLLQGQLALLSEFQVSQGHIVRPCLKQRPTQNRGPMNGILCCPGSDIHLPTSDNCCIFQFVSFSLPRHLCTSELKCLQRQVFFFFDKTVFCLNSISSTNNFSGSLLLKTFLYCV